MSMKSFDKFCERMILAEPSSEKEIFDERQNQQRTALTVQALIVYCVATAVFVFLNDDLHFVESSAAGLVFFAGLSYLWWVIRANIKGCLFGVSGKQVIYNALGIIAEMTVAIPLVMNQTDGGVHFIKNGMLSDVSAVIAGFIMYTVSAVIKVVVYFRSRKKPE